MGLSSPRLPGSAFLALFRAQFWALFWSRFGLGKGLQKGLEMGSKPAQNVLRNCFFFASKFRLLFLGLGGPFGRLLGPGKVPLAGAGTPKT